MFQPRKKNTTRTGHPWVLNNDPQPQPARRRRVVVADGEQEPEEEVEPRVSEPRPAAAGVSSYSFSPVRLLAQILIVTGLVTRALYKYEIPWVTETVDRLANAVFRMNEEYSYGVCYHVRVLL